MDVLASAGEMDALASGLLYVGLLAVLIGALSIVKPIRRLGLARRSRALVVCLSGLNLAAGAAVLPASFTTVENHACRLDDFLPTYHFHEVHNTVIKADPAAVYAAIKAVTPGEITGYQALTWLRSPRFGAAPPSLLAAPSDQPILDVAMLSGFMLLADQPAQEIVIGAIGFGPAPGGNPGTASPDAFLKFDRPGYVKVALNFTLAAEPGGGSSIFTETRAFATDGGATRAFGAYWRAILPGSSWIRGAWLRAIKARAER